MRGLRLENAQIRDIAVRRNQVRCKIVDGLVVQVFRLVKTIGFITNDVTDAIDIIFYDSHSFLYLLMSRGGHGNIH